MEPPAREQPSTPTANKKAAVDRGTGQPAPSATPAGDVRCSGSAAPSAPAAKKKAVVKKAAMDRGIGRWAPSAALPPSKAAVPVPSCALAGPGSRSISAAARSMSMEPPAEEQATLKRSRTEAGLSGGETLPPDIEYPDVTSTPTLSLFLSSIGSKRKRTPRPSITPEAEQAFANDEAEEDVGDRRVSEDLRAGLDGETGHGWSEQGYGGEDSDDFDRGYTVEGVVDERVVEAPMVDGFLQGEEDRKFRSKVWDEFIKVRVAGVVIKGKCVHCNMEINAKRGAGTSAMLTHLKRCRERLSVTQVTNQLKSTVMSPEGIALKDWRFRQDVSRKELARMISLHGFPLAIVDYDGFRRFVSSLNPVFKMVARRTITDDCTKRYQEEKQVLQAFLKNVKSRVSLTMDMWTSNQTLGYMCITCHFTDDDWKIHKRILKFSFMKTPHTGVAMFNEVLKSLQEWKIEDKLFAITMDNAAITML